MADVGRKRVEVICVVLLGSSAVASSWCAYQSQLWGGIQASRYAEGTRLLNASTRAAAVDGQLAAVDVSSFLAWSQATASGQTQLADFLHSRFRPAFREIFD